MGSTGEVLEGERRLPAAHLRPYVAFYSGYRQTGGEPGRHRGLPSPFLTLILTLDEPLLMADSREGAANRSYDALVGGLHTTPAHVLHPGRQSGIQLALTPLGARALLGLPAGEIAHLDAHLEDVAGPSVRLVRERLLAARSWPERFAVVDAWLSSRLDIEAALRPELAECWRVLTGPAAVPIDAVARHVGWSARHLRGQLQAEVGLTPKVAARVARFDRTRRLLGQQLVDGRPASLAELAAVCGYADQAHLAREFGELAGCSPSAWIAEEFRNVQADDGFFAQELSA